ncbi:protein-L-isoaspartate O-methyltransferase domain-containing protein 2 [Thecamonas trahens ATCC 50062]|uniref:Protein-L-isoaspartate O-methyltransferase domain-containing protein 2 n=1 Tax=Thecamonas trahens ATCC 50062 TaxID=461836 RepID=A0A0L0DLM6_THETB|nr:protein-L-isoaspartate O-methyltransferase domain-containing protein 2 [Thecamonas trahens ATCC 50062]KNC53214.1 protein-L-isoaspartate O-methyltransferase domain-containing protein 2 [Thecamonas trahens ATCC 50062]|eukprot:XP_013754683.1 protein-L-isoaspartate O-methyltransferase domain-containing protein 2 [Thecamonas trahens ATCC 50062]
MGNILHGYPSQDELLDSIHTSRPVRSATVYAFRCIDKRFFQYFPPKPPTTSAPDEVTHVPDIDDGSSSSGDDDLPPPPYLPLTAAPQGIDSASDDDSLLSQSSDSDSDSDADSEAGTDPAPMASALPMAGPPSLPIQVERSTSLYELLRASSSNESEGSYLAEPWSQLLPGGGRLHHSAVSIYMDVVDALELCPGETFLNIGSGSGYLSTVASILLGPTGCSLGVELDEAALEWAKARTDELFSSPWINTARMRQPHFFRGDALSLASDTLRFDAIYVGSGIASDAHIRAFYALLKPGGRLVVPYQANVIRLHHTPAGAETTVVTPGTIFAPVVDDGSEVLPDGTDPMAEIETTLAARMLPSLFVLAADALRSQWMLDDGIVVGDDLALTYTPPLERLRALIGIVPMDTLEFLNGGVPLDIATCAYPGCLKRFAADPLPTSTSASSATLSSSASSSASMTSSLSALRCCCLDHANRLEVESLSSESG